MSDVSEVLIKNIRNRLQDLGWSDAKLAENLDTTRTQISQWMNGHKTPSLENIQRIAKALDISITELLTEKSEKVVHDHDLIECYRRVGHNLQLSVTAHSSTIRREWATLSAALHDSQLRAGIGYLRGMVNASENLKSQRNKGIKKDSSSA